MGEAGVALVGAVRLGFLRLWPTARAAGRHGIGGLGIRSAKSLIGGPQRAHGCRAIVGQFGLMGPGPQENKSFSDFMNSISNQHKS
jgi:hypothetical protein